MKIIHRSLQLDTGDGIKLHDLSGVIRDHLAASGIANGLMTVTSRHTTTAITLNENEQRLMSDILRFFGRLAPAGEHYDHNDIALRDCPPDEPANAHSHLLAMLVGSSEAIPVVAGELDLGRWQSVMLVELDGPRQRRVGLQIIGE